MKTNSSPDIKIFLIGNKADLEEHRVVNKAEAEKWKEDYDLDYFTETSAKTGMNAQELFIEAARILYKDFNVYHNEKKKQENNVNAKLNKKDENNQKKGCC